ncbi:predicted protein [Coccidioides posadasii str. Silveira]|uniref:Predicted protein n=1 Tax=Coccidioides posadasii (strain RMSCC 757 / Silveira) TaxID=443226 RepID=E9CXX5_COCPS|nr:predicted protein [Coccidioides posadasii str. Silveira]
MATVSTVLDHFHILQRAGGSGPLRYRLGRMQEMETMVLTRIYMNHELKSSIYGLQDSVLGNDSRGTITGGLRMSFFINQGVYLCNKPNETCKIITPPSAAILKDLENLRSTVPKCQHTKGMSTAKNPNT